MLKRCRITMLSFSGRLRREPGAPRLPLGRAREATCRYRRVKYQSDPGSGSSSANSSVGARVGDSLIGVTMVARLAPSVEKCGEMVCVSWLVDGSGGSE